MLKTMLGRLRFVALSEGVSYVLLLGIAMPLKYLWDRPEAVRIAGMAHGVLFILLAAALLKVHMSRRWGLKFSALVMFSSMVPLGAFWMDRKLKAIDDQDAAE